jgi:radical SAM protein with 4Fe4S-binding SPASM domain
MNLRHARTLGRAAHQVVRANFQRLPVPLKINFAITYSCQYRCRTCNIWKRKPTGELTTSEILKFVHNTAGVSWLDVTGGEIFLRADIDIVLEAIVSTWDRLLLLHFPTNGFLTDRIVRVCERLVALKGPQIIVTVSIDGNERLNDDIRGIRGGYRRQIQTFNALRKVHGVRPVFGMTLSRHNLGRFEETLRACQQDCADLSVEDFHLNVAQHSTHYYGNSEMADVLPTKAEALHELRVYHAMRRFPRTMAEWVESEYLRRLRNYLQTNAMPMRCHSLRSSCFIDPGGTVYPCITYSRPLGSLRENGMDLSAIWNAPATAAIQQQIWQGECPQCWTACEAYQTILGNLTRPYARPRAHTRSDTVAISPTTQPKQAIELRRLQATVPESSGSERSNI